jgi:hypothetical protein
MRIKEKLTTLRAVLNRSILKNGLVRTGMRKHEARYIWKIQSPVIDSFSDPKE